MRRVTAALARHLGFFDGILEFVGEVSDGTVSGVDGESTMEFFAKAIKKTAASWVRELNIDRAALSMAKKRGRLALAVAGYMAMKLGANPEHWVAVAALEAESESEALLRLRKSASTWRRR